MFGSVPTVQYVSFISGAVYSFNDDMWTNAIPVVYIVTSSPNEYLIEMISVHIDQPGSMPQSQLSAHHMTI
jgi:hypothetical protein